MRLYSHIVRYDGGFAPCIAEGTCTLACCKPVIRRKAKVGDWVLGTTPAKRGAGRMVYLMRVDALLTFADYWRDLRLAGRDDNIYQPLGNGRYKQKKNAWHGCGTQRRDLRGKQVLVSKSFVYFGKSAPKIPPSLQDLASRGRGHRVFEEAQQRVQQLKKWAFARGRGRKGLPFEHATCHDACHR
jgi:hypothetical protein